MTLSRPVLDYLDAEVTRLGIPRSEVLRRIVDLHREYVAVERARVLGDKTDRLRPLPQVV